MTTTALFTVDDLNSLPEISGVDDAEAVVVERIVWGWLQPVLGVTERPDPVSDKLFAWALELAAIYRTNPAGLSAKELGPFKEDYSSERRDELLRIAAGGGTTAGAALPPRGSFPPAQRYPDPARSYIPGPGWW